MFKLFNRLDNGLVPMAAIVKEFIESVGISHISTREAKIKAAEVEGKKEKVRLEENEKNANEYR